MPSNINFLELLTSAIKQITMSSKDKRGHNGNGVKAKQVKKPPAKKADDDENSKFFCYINL